MAGKRVACKDCGATFNVPASTRPPMAAPVAGATFETRCPSCGRTVAVPVHLVGKRVRCTGCSHPFDVVAPASEAAPPPAAVVLSNPQVGGVSPPPPPPPAIPLPSGASEPTSPVPRRRPRKKHTQPIAIGLGVATVAFAVATFFALWPFGGGLRRYASYVPDDPAIVARIDVRQLRASKVHSLRNGLDAVLGELWVEKSLDDVEEVFAAAASSRESDMVVVVRTTGDHKLSEMGSAGTRESYAGIDYMQLGSGRLIARTEPRMFCIARSEKTLKSTLDRLKDGHAPKLDDEFKDAIRNVSGHDAYIVATVPSEAAFGIVTVVAAGSSVSSAGMATGSAFVFFRNARYASAAEKIAEGVLDGGQAAAEDIADRIGGSQGRFLRDVSRLTRDMHLSHSGNRLRVDWTTNIDDYFAVVDKAESAMSELSWLLGRF